MIDTGFIINGVDSDSLGLYNIRLSGGFFNVPYMSESNIIETTTAKSDVPILHRVSRKPLEFSLTISKLDGVFTPDDMFYFAKLFKKNRYVSFQTKDDLSKVYYVICTNQVDFTTNGVGHGWFEAHLRCNAPWAWSLPEVYEFDRRGLLGTTVTLYNKSNFAYYEYPDMEITLDDSTVSFSIVNTSDENRTVTFTDLEIGEVLYIQNKYSYIYSSTDTERASDWNKIQMRLLQGENILFLSGGAKYQFRIQHALMV